MSKVRVCFFGTPEFATVALKSLLQDKHFEVVGVITQPDRPSGRKLQLTPSPVKSLALSGNLKVLAPESLKNNVVITDAIKSWGAEVGVVVAYGQILTESFLQSFPLGCVNIHGSLLPRWRGAAPIQRAIEAGETVTGVTLQKIVKRLDAGDMIGSRKLEISTDMDAQQVHDQLAVLGADMLRVELMDYVRGNLAPIPQDEALMNYARKIEKSEALLDWQESAEKIHNKVRAFVMGPGTYMMLNDKKIKIHKTALVSDSLSDRSSKPPGELIVKNNQMFMTTGEGLLQILFLQPESRNRVTAEEFLKGYQV